MNQSVTLEELRRSAPGFAARQKKHLSQLRYAWAGPKRTCFVFGCQRSGTKMVMRILDHSPATRILHENNATAFSDFQLRPDPVLRALAAAHPAPSQVFKPICDSQEADRILDRFPDSRGMWVYRNPDDVANSAVVKWGEHQRDIVGAAVAGDLDRWGWRTARISDRILADLRGAWRDDLSPHEGALLFWYMRNAFFFELGLDAHPRMLLVRYEDLVTDPLAAFPALFDQVGAPFDPAFVATVRTSSVGRRDPPDASPRIRALCDDLLARLDAQAARSAPAASASTAAPAPDRPVPSPTLVLINTLGVGGAERYVVTIANWMHARGAQVAVAAREGAMAEELDAGVRFLPTDLHDLRLSLLRAAGQVRGMLTDLQPEIIVTNSLVVTWVARLAQVRRRIPIVAVAHGWPAERYSRVGPLMRIADRVVAVSPDVRDKLVAGGLDPARCQVVFNGVDCSPFGPREGAHREVAREAMGAGPDDLVVINVGRLTDQKAHQHVVTIAQQLRDHSPRLHFVVVGRGPRKEELQQLVADAGLQDRVHFLGARKDVADLLGSADIYLSTSDWEGMPLSTIEAMATGLPVVATRTEGSDQLLTASCGIVCEVGDTAGLADALVQLATDDDARRSMGEAARTRALDQFGHDRMARELVAVLHEVLQR